MIEYVLTGTCRSYAEVPRGARLLAVAGRDVVGSCVACGGPVLDGQDYDVYSGEERELVHRRCPRGLAAARSEYTPEQVWERYREWMAGVREAREAEGARAIATVVATVELWDALDAALEQKQAAERRLEAQRLLLGKAEALLWTLLAAQDANRLLPQMKALHAELLAAAREGGE